MNWKYILTICILTLLAFTVGMVSSDSNVDAREVVTVMPAPITVMPPAVTVVVTIECCESCLQQPVVAPLLFIPTATATPQAQSTNTNRDPDPKNTPQTIINTPIPPSTEPPIIVTDPPATDPPPTEPPVEQNGCNQGRGNGSEGCDPGNSNHNQISNDEPGHRGKGRKK